MGDDAGVVDYIDTHAHLDLAEFAPDRDAVIDRARKAGVRRMITVGIGMAECRAALALASRHSDIYAAIGVHPHNASSLDLAALDFLEQHATNEKVVALGEMGLDFYRDRSPRADQERCFRAQLDLARSLRLPVIVHDRDAHAETLALLRAERAADVGGVIHCFSGDMRMARACIDLGFYISIPGTVTFKNARNLHAVAQQIPLERMLIETDCPYLVPVPFRGKRNEPAYVVHVAARIARLREVSAAEVAAATSANARRLFGIG